MPETPYRKVNVVDENGDLVTFSGGVGTGDASAANQTTEISRLTDIRDRLPSGVASEVTLAQVRDRLMPSTGVNRTHILANASSGLSKGSPATLYNASCSNTGSSKKYLLFFNKATAPAPGDAPYLVIPVPAADSVQDGFAFIGQSELGGGGSPFDTGLGWGISTTNTIFTAATASETVISFRWM